jgi:hypothetical protein
MYMDVGYIDDVSSRNFRGRGFSNDGWELVGASCNGMLCVDETCQSRTP